jgi:biopolymer transport protein ExbD
MRGLVPPAPLVVKINVTPIIDVALVLVIILLITAPMLTTTAFDVDLPATRTRNVEDATLVTVSLGRGDQLAVDGATTARADLSRSLRAKLAEHAGEDVVVVVRADASIRHDAVRALLNELKEAGAERLAIATRPEVVP